MGTAVESRLDSFDTLLDLAHDMGAKVQWGRCTLHRQGKKEPQCWVSLEMPDGLAKEHGKTWDSAAWVLLQKEFPPPDDQPDP